MRKKSFTYLLFSCGLVIISSCTKNDLPSDQPIGKVAELSETELRMLPRLTEASHKVGEQEAVDKATNILNLLAQNEGPTTRSGQQRTIKSMKVLTMENLGVTIKTRSGEAVVQFPDTAVYVFNFSDNGGYALISADKRVEADVLAFSGEGFVGDSTDNPGFGLFLSYAEDYIASQITKYESEKDSIYNEILLKLGNDFFEDGSSGTKANITTETGYVEVPSGNWTIKQRVSPMIPVEWGQGAPFWDKVRNKIPTGDAAVGCVPTMAAQIMSYWKYPTTIEGMSLNWNEINKYTGLSSYFNRNGIYKYWSAPMDIAPTEIKNQVASLMEIIGRNIGVKYGSIYNEGSGGINSGDAVNYLMRLGYIGPASRGYDYGTIKMVIDRGRPVIIRGDRSKIKHTFLGINIYSTYDGGHSWIADGYMESSGLMIQYYYVKERNNDNGIYTIISKTETGRYSQTRNFIHFNWGWNGSYNGYFLAGCFDAESLGRVESDGITKSDGAANFQWNCQIWFDVRR